MYRIRRFGVIRTATIVAVMYLIGTAVVFVPLVILGGVAGIAAGGNAGAVSIGLAVLGLLFAVGYGVLGWVVTAIACVLYNVAAGWVGGIELQLEAVAPPPPPQAWAPTTTVPPASPTA